MPLSLIKSGRIEEWDDMIDVNIKGVLTVQTQFLTILWIKDTVKL